jgi:hypothetical protein
MRIGAGGSFSTPGPFVDPFAPPFPALRLATADINGDGTPDVIGIDATTLYIARSTR